MPVPWPPHSTQQPSACVKAGWRDSLGCSTGGSQDVVLLQVRYNYVAVAKTTHPCFIAPFTSMGTSLRCGHSVARPAQWDVSRVTFIFVCFTSGAQSRPLKFSLTDLPIEFFILSLYSFCVFWRNCRNANIILLNLQKTDRVLEVTLLVGWQSTVRITRWVRRLCLETLSVAVTLQFGCQPPNKDTWALEWQSWLCAL